MWSQGARSEVTAGGQEAAFLKPAAQGTLPSSADGGRGQRLQTLKSGKIPEFQAPEK